MILNIFIFLSLRRDGSHENLSRSKLCNISKGSQKVVGGIGDQRE